MAMRESPLKPTREFTKINVEKLEYSFGVCKRCRKERFYMPSSEMLMVYSVFAEIY
jgi:hypothetical protein